MRGGGRGARRQEKMKGEEARKEKGGVERQRKNGEGKNTDDYLTTSNHTQEQNEYLRDVLNSSGTY